MGWDGVDGMLCLIIIGNHEHEENKFYLGLKKPYDI